MADLQTTSSKTLIQKDRKDPIKSSLTKPKVSEVQIVNSLAKSLNESYQYVKQKQQLYKDISSGEHMRNSKRRKVLSPVAENKENEQKFSSNSVKDNQTEWQEVLNNKNKLKRKKKLSASLTSVSDSVNQEKRTRIEGIHLNCRGKLQIKENPEGNLEIVTHQTASSSKTLSPLPSSFKNETEKVLTKPPIPPTTHHKLNLGTHTSAPVPPPPRLKRKLIENVQTIQKLNTLTEHLRLEINELKSSLTTERGAVRVLRAQNECESRKWKSEVKKLQQQIDLMRKGVLANAKKQIESSTHGYSDSTILTSTTGLVNYEIQRLTNEIQMLKDANKTLEEKNLINYDADRRKTADIRELRDSYENRLTQIQKSAKVEISRLLEEIKTKERNIGQLKKDLQVLQNQTSSTRTSNLISNSISNKRSLSTNTKNSKPLNTNPTTNDSQKLTPTNLKKQTNKKPKKSTSSSTSVSTTTSTSTTSSTNTTTTISTSSLTKKTQDPVIESPLISINDHHQAEGSDAISSPVKDSNDDNHTNEITQLRNIELIKNTKNLKTSSVSATNGTPSTNGVNLLTQKQNNILQSLENNTENQKNLLNNLLTTKSQTKSSTTSETPKTICGSCQREYFTMPPEMNENYLTNPTPVSKTSSEEIVLEKQTHSNRCNDLPIYRSKDVNSDSDSALSSAPPSISPQPPANGLEPNDIWQTIRTYTQDSERLQKEVEQLQQENERLQKELNLAKEQIIDLEKTAIEATKQTNVQQYLERIRFLEEQEHHLQNECSELREQNELLEFRILELEETNDKWSLQSHVPPTTSAIGHNSSNSPTSHTNANRNDVATKDLWSSSSTTSSSGNSTGSNSSHSSHNSSHGSNSNKSKLDPMQLLFGNSSNSNCMIDSGITSPHSQLHTEDDFQLMDISNEELCRRLSNMVKKTSSLDEDDKQYLQQVIALVQHYDLLSQRTSGPASLNTSCSSSDEPSSLEMAKSRISDYSSASSSSAVSLSNARNLSSSCDSLSKASKVSGTLSGRSSGSSTLGFDEGCTSSETIVVPSLSAASAISSSSRIVATVPPYNTSSNHHPHHHHHHTALIVPTNTPNDSPRKLRSTTWQNSSLSESGVFVEDSDCLDANIISSEQSISTQTDFLEEDLSFSKPYQQKLQRYHSSPPTRQTHPSSTTLLSDHKHLQFYKDRLELLESKVRIYESSGDIQAKHLADRLQREIQLEKQLKEFQERVESLESENLSLEEEKCEFEEAENDTRLRLQRLEIELEILSQRNVELELSKEALSAKYKDCRSECMILREDLEACERQVQLIDEERIKSKKHFEFLHSLIPLYCCYSAIFVTNLYKEQEDSFEMGNVPSHTNLTGASSMVMKSPSKESPSQRNDPSHPPTTCSHCGQDRNQTYHLKEENIALRLQMNEMKTQHFTALETADNQWVDLEKSYKDREEAFLTNEHSLKQKISKLQECLREDTKAANEKISQLEESEESLKLCLVRMSKEHRDLFEKYKVLCEDIEHLKDENEKLTEESKPTLEALESEKRQCKEFQEELQFMRHLQKEAESRYKSDEEDLRSTLSDFKKQILHADVTNSELKEEVATLEEELVNKQHELDEAHAKLRELYDELRSQEDIIEKMECFQKNFHIPPNSLAQELKDRINSDTKSTDEDDHDADADEEDDSKSDDETKTDDESKSDEAKTTSCKKKSSLSEYPSDETFCKACRLKKVFIEDCNTDKDYPTSPSFHQTNNNLVFTSILKKGESKPTSVVTSNGSLISASASELKSKDILEVPSSTITEALKDVVLPIKGEEIKDLTTARTALEGAFKHYETLQATSDTAQSEFQGVLSEVINLVDGIIQLKNSSQDNDDVSLQSEESDIEEERMRRLVKEEARKLEAKHDVSSEIRLQSRLIRRSSQSTRSSGLNLRKSEVTQVSKTLRTSQKPELPFIMPEQESEQNSKDTTIEGESSSQLESIVSEEKENDNMNVTVNMALVPPVVTNDVPSELGKKKCGEMPFARPNLTVPISKSKKISGNLVQIRGSSLYGSEFCMGKKRRGRKRRHKPTIPVIPSQVEGIFTHTEKNLSTNQVDYVELESPTSKDSFHSVTPWVSARSDKKPTLYTHTIDIHDIVPLKSTVDQGTETITTKHEISIQVDEEDSAKAFILTLPVRLRDFIYNVANSMPACVVNQKCFYSKFQKCWNEGKEIRSNLLALCEYAENITLGLDFHFDNYKKFVEILPAFQVLNDIFRPYQVEYLKSLENRVNESLMSYHTKKFENDYYCTVYYPVKRTANFNFIKQ